MKPLFLGLLGIDWIGQGDPVELGDGHVVCVEHADEVLVLVHQEAVDLGPVGQLLDEFFGLLDEQFVDLDQFAVVTGEGLGLLVELETGDVVDGDDGGDGGNEFEVFVHEGSFRNRCGLIIPHEYTANAAKKRSRDDSSLETFTSGGR